MASLRVPVIAGVALQLSVAVAMPGLPVKLQTPSSALRAIFAGQVITGASLSVTVTVCVALAVLPLTSVTFQVIVVVPTGYTADRGCESLRTPVGEPTPQLSVAVAPALTLAPQMPGLLLTEIFEVLITGAVLSVTVT